MMREGALASYIGPVDGGVLDGDRCLVLADEGSYSQVRWVTGALTGQYAAVRNAHLVSDRKTKVSVFDEDEFGFENENPRAVRVAVGMVYGSGGDAALMRALDHDGVLEGPRVLARRAVATVKEALQADPAWAEVVSELGEHGRTFLTAVVRQALDEAIDEGVEDAPQPEPEQAAGF